MSGRRELEAKECALLEMKQHVLGERRMAVVIRNRSNE
jgi:hypothetical protein